MPPFQWTERRIARFITIIVTAVVVVFSIVLFIMVRSRADAFPAPWDRTISIATGCIFLFALWRLRRQVRLFREDR